MRRWAFIAALLFCAWCLAFMLRDDFANTQSAQATLWSIASSLHAPGDTTTQTAATSPVPAAWQMRVEIQQLLSRGETRQQILQTMVAQYGPTALADPSTNGFGLLVWLLPGAALAVAAVALLIAYAQVRRRQEADGLQTEVQAKAQASSVDAGSEWRTYF